MITETMAMALPPSTPTSGLTIPARPTWRAPIMAAALPAMWP